MPEIFISYKREDRYFAEKLRQHLLAWGYSVWMDVYDIPPGAHWPDAIDEGISSAHTVIGVMSPKAVQSRNVKNEWDWAIVNRRRLLLMMVERCSIPVNYVSINYIDATKDHSVAYDLLHSALKSHSASVPVSDEAYSYYLETLYDRINTILAHAIIKVDEREEPQPINLRSKRVRGAVDELFEKREEVDPFFVAMGITNRQLEGEIGDFRTAFEHFDGRVLLLGEPGAGKTITLLQFGRDAIVQRIQNPTSPLPILALIPTWDASIQPSLTDWIAASYGTPANAKQIIEDGRALLLLDGLDELGSERKDPVSDKPYDPRKRFIAKLADLPQNQVVITCRTADYGSVDAKLPLSGAVMLQRLTDSQMKQYLAQLPSLWTALEADKQLRDIARTPLLLSFFAFAYRDMPPEVVAELHELKGASGKLRDAIFERYVDERYAHEKRKLAQRREQMPYSLEEIYDTLGRVAMENASRGVRNEAVQRYSGRKRRRRGRDLFEENIIEAGDFKRALGQKSITAFVDLAMHLQFVRGYETEYYSFIHTLLRDYFAFRYAVKHLTDTALYQFDHPFVPRPTPAWALGCLQDKRAIEPLLAAVDHEDHAIRFDVHGALGRIRDDRALAVMFRALGDPDDGIRQIAMESLQEYDGEAVKPFLRKALQDPNPFLRSEAVMLFGIPFGENQDFEAIAALMKDEASLVRASAVRALWWLHDPKGAELVINALSDIDADVRAAAAEAIREWTLELSNEGPERETYSLDALDYLKSDKCLYALLAKLMDADSSVRANAIDALSALRDTRAFDGLVDALTDSDEDVREGAARALGWMGDVRAVDPLEPLLSDDVAEVRAWAAYALGLLNNEKAFRLAVRALSDSSDRVREYAASALGHRGDKRAVKHLIALLSLPPDEASPRTRRATADTLVRIGTPEAIAAAISWYSEALFSEEEWLQDWAAKALLEIDTPEAVAAVEKWRAQ